MRKLAGLITLLVVLVFVNATANAQTVSVLGDRISIEKDGGILTLVWTAHVALFQTEP
jgi:hypothetical protein